MGGFGVFTKAIQNALLDGRADVAVHSLKDLPTIPTDGADLAATPPRGPTGDAFVSQKHARFDDLPQGATVGTSSLRRRAQLLNRRPDLNLVDLRGNVDTRLRKLDEQNLDAIILAEAGLVRLGLARRDHRSPRPDVDAAGRGPGGDRPGVPRSRRRDTRQLARSDQPRGDLAARDGRAGDARDARRRLPRADRGDVDDSRRRADAARAWCCQPRRPAARSAPPTAARPTTPLAVGQELAAMLLDEGAAGVAGLIFLVTTLRVVTFWPLCGLFAERVKGS